VLSAASLTRTSMATLRDALADLRHRIAEADVAADALPHRRKCLLLVMAHLCRRRERQPGGVAAASRS
jgi:hypothetical protein